VTFRLAPRLLILLLSLCASRFAAAAEPPSTKVVNVLPFDLGVCFLQPVAVATPVNEIALSGLWLAARPAVVECLRDSRNYVAGKSSAFKLTLTLSDAGYTRVVESEGLLEMGRKCIEDAVGRTSPTLEPLAAGSKPVVYTAQVPELKTDQVRFGVNEFSNVAGVIRLAMPSMCSCFEVYKTTPDPAPVDLRVQVTKAPEKFKFPDGGMPRPVEVTFTTSGAPPAMTSCAEGKLSALNYPSTSEQIVVPYRFFFINALAQSSDVAALADPSLKFAQLEAMAYQRSAATQLQQARVVAASTRYNGMVNEYRTLSKSNPKKANAMVKDLSTACQQLVTQDDALIAAGEAEYKLHQETLAVIAAGKAKDPTWAETEAGTQKLAASAQAVITKGREIRTADEKACPKLKF
jgi:hypothetical protein